MTPAGPRDRAGRLVSGDANNANSADEASRAGQGNAGKKKERCTQKKSQVVALL